MASLQRNGQYFCGGSIIAKYWIITASHCTERPARLFKVRVGSNKSNEGGKLIAVEEFINHENYHVKILCGNDDCSVWTRRPASDIALVHLRESIIFSETQQPIALFADGESPATGALAVVSGWGDLGNGTYPHTLHSVAVPIISRDVCSQIYNDEQVGLICAGYVGTGGKDACGDDSGGPLAIDGRLVGIVSYGRDCGTPQYPGVYTQVSRYRAWIRDKCGV